MVLLVGLQRLPEYLGRLIELLVVDLVVLLLDGDALFDLLLLVLLVLLQQVLMRSVVVLDVARDLLQHRDLERVRLVQLDKTKQCINRVNTLR